MIKAMEVENRIKNNEHPQPSLELMRAGITNFLGQSISLIPFEGKEKNKLVVAMLMEEVLKTSQVDKNNPCDLDILTSVFKSVKIALEQNIVYINKSKQLTDKDKQDIIDYMDIIDLIDEKFLKKEKTSTLSEMSRAEDLCSANVMFSLRTDLRATLS